MQTEVVVFFVYRFSFLLRMIEVSGSVIPIRWTCWFAGRNCHLRGSRSDEVLTGTPGQKRSSRSVPRTVESHWSSPSRISKQRAKRVESTTVDHSGLRGLVTVVQYSSRAASRYQRASGSLSRSQGSPEDSPLPFSLSLAAQLSILEFLVRLPKRSGSFS